MKKVMATIAAALLGVFAAQAADPTFAYSGAGCRTLIVDGDGTSWGTLTISGGASSSTNVFDAAKIAFGGSLRLTATDAERLKLKVHYVRLGR